MTNINSENEANLHKLEAMSDRLLEPNSPKTGEEFRKKVFEIQRVTILKFMALNRNGFDVVKLKRLNRMISTFLDINNNRRHSEDYVIGKLNNTLNGYDIV